MNAISIGEVARRSDIGIETIRFYEREGLVDEPPRSMSGYRQYSGDVVARLVFIKRAKELGFTLKEIRELLFLKLDANTSCAEVKTRTEVKLDDIEARIESLEQMKTALLKLTSTCTGSGPVSNCPILDALEFSEKKNMGESCE